MQITASELVERLLNLKGAKPVTITAATEPEMVAKDNPYKGRVTKISRVNGMIGWNYENAVNRQQQREGGDGDFEVSPRKWGQRITGTPLVQHGDKFYVELRVGDTLGHEYVDSETGNVIDRTAVEPFLRQRKSSAEAQGVVKEIVLRDYSISSIRQISVGGETFQITN